MTQRNRKLIGVLLMLSSIVLWLGIGTAIYLNWLQGAAWFVLIPYFCVAGMGWLFPAMSIIRWMSRPD